MRNINSNNAKAILVSICLIFLSISCKSQDSINYSKNYIGLSITELLFADFRISYELRLNISNGLKFEVGYKPGFTNFTDATNIDLGQKATAWCYRNTANWLYFSLGYKYYFNKKKTIYFSPELFYKKLYADNIVYTWGINEGGSNLTNQYENRTMSTNIFGLNLLIGKRFEHNKDNSRIGFDIFCGLSLRSKTINTTIYGRTITTYPHDSPPKHVIIPAFNNPIEEVDNYVQPSFQFGIIISGSWN